jgi:acetoin utilization protein AcuB
MRRMPTIKAVMTPFPYSVDVGASVAAARALMQEHQISHLPVTRDGELAGIVAERDIRLLLGTDPAVSEFEQTTVAEAMVKDTYIVDMDTRLDEVLNHMAETHLSSALVTRHGKLVGVFTVTDACRHFAEFLQEQVRRSGGDDAA